MAEKKVMKVESRFTRFLTCVMALAVATLGGRAGAAASATPPEGARVSIEAVGPVASEMGPRVARFLLHRTGPIGRPLEVYYEITGSAVNGADYSKLGSSVLFPESASTVEIVIEPATDGIVEGSETVVLTLVPAPPSASGYVISWPAVAAIQIEDVDRFQNDPSWVRIGLATNDCPWTFISISRGRARSAPIFWKCPRS